MKTRTRKIFGRRIVSAETIETRLIQEMNLARLSGDSVTAARIRLQLNRAYS